MPRKKRQIKRQLNLVEHEQNELCDFKCSFLTHYQNLESTLKKYSCEELTPEEAYSWFFNLSEDESEMCSIQENNKEPNRKFLPSQDTAIEKPIGARTNKPNPIIYCSKRDAEGCAISFHYVLFKNDWVEKLHKAQKMDFAIMNLLTYYGGKNKAMLAGVCYGLILDLDGIDQARLETFLQASLLVDDIYPLPNAIALSGTGLHLYYLFEKPVNLTHRMREWLKWLKYNLIYTLWNSYTSIYEPQFSSINQGFRLLGGPTKVKGLRVKVFKVNDNKWSLFSSPNSLSSFISPQTEELVSKHMLKPDLPEIAPIEKELYPRKRVTYEEAKELWPEWWSRVDQAKKEGREVQLGSFKVNKNFYDHWLKLISTGASVGNRYYRIYTLSCVAAKCKLPFAELKEDADRLQVRFNLIGAPTFPFTESDEDAGLKGYYDARATRYTYRQLCLWTHVPYNPIPKAKKPTPFKDAYYAQKELEALRQGEEYQREKFTRKQALEMFAREKGELILKKKRASNPNFFSNSGRKAAEALVKDWLRENPYGSVKACSEALKITAKTTRKYFEMFNGPLNAKEAVERFRHDNPNAKIKDCVKATLLSVRSVKSFWGKSDKLTD